MHSARSTQSLHDDNVDFELHARWLNGDKRAGDRLVKHHYKDVSDFFATKVGDEERQDLMQETFKRLCCAAVRFSRTSTFKSFLLGIAKNVFYEFLRERYRRAHGEHDEFDSERHSLEDFGQLSISRLISALMRHHVVMQCLRALPVETKQMLESYYWHDMTAIELGDIYGIPPATVRTRMMAARERLKQMLECCEPSLGSIDVEQQLTTLQRLLGFGPCQIDG
jgi:RNA polymerase sigma factor (sigma-70 family)